ncbi:hypothetical protein NC796_11205 [Aliifodinibius sp. S!AR15-10]|uniref:hypothetical protein n=1 Tax=Aliifodinibius sp. S!AR15-10 TaxID=2950437 RepID=UPI00285DA78C|nr:hypothetical protein [Aliifodinibius sp. S!AR15-10]MDR8391713.1 hypothetical protein [Aliifodinibius sp. S!AR15-10]
MHRMAILGRIKKDLIHWLVNTFENTIFATALLVIAILFESGCKHHQDRYISQQSAVGNDSTFGHPVSVGKIQSGEMDEVSGIAVSRHNSNYIWAHNDSGDDPRLFLVDKEGKLVRSYHLAGAENRDWEDMAIGPGPNSNRTYLYVADIGDNSPSEEILQIYRLPEPEFIPNTSQPVDTLENVEKLEFRYPENRSYNAETLLIDPLTRDLYIVTKYEGQEKLFRLSYPQATSNVDTAELTGTIPFFGMLGGDISADGRMIILKTQTQVLIWHLNEEETPTSITDKIPGRLPYNEEPQGEALGIAPDGSGYYTISEYVGGKSPVIYYYPRITK